VSPLAGADEEAKVVVEKVVMAAAAA